MTQKDQLKIRLWYLDTVTSVLVRSTAGVTQRRIGLAALLCMIVSASFGGFGQLDTTIAMNTVIVAVTCCYVSPQMQGVFIPRVLLREVVGAACRCATVTQKHACMRRVSCLS